ncbi:YphA family membrane protein [Gracilibacillus boraciitolerans]|uniref:YphA family membrane protein n=1 Tax=Gracilibacillus boraciitolerans TaxID=307521 RepID=UPI003F6F60FD
MYQIIIVWLCWLLWCFATFFLQKTKIRIIYAIGLLFCLILLPYQISIVDLPVNLSFLVIVFSVSIGIIYSRLPLKKLFFILFIIYLYVIYFLWRLTSPHIE